MTKNKIVWLLGQGIDGVGSTKFQIEFNKQFNEVKIVNYKSDFAKYANSKNFELTNCQIVETNNIFDELKDSKIIFINSFPNNKNSLQEIDNFYEQLERLHKNGNILCGFMHFNTNAYMNKIPKMLFGINLLDYIFTFDVNSDFANIVRKYLPHKVDRLRSFALPFETSEVKGYNKKNQCIYLGRYATFKRPEGMFRLLEQNTINTEFSCYGVGKTIEMVISLINNPLALYHKTLSDEPVAKSLNLYGIIKNKDGMMKLRDSMFAYSGFHLPEHNYGQRFEYAMAEMIENECVCIFNTHFLKSIMFDGVSLYERNIFLDYDGTITSAKLVNDKMKEISENEELRLKIVQAQKEILLMIAQPKIVVSNILEEIKNIDCKTKDRYLFLYDLIGKDKLNIPNIAYDVSDLRRKDIRVYNQVNTRLRKQIYENMHSN